MHYLITNCEERYYNLQQVVQNLTIVITSISIDSRSRTFKRNQKSFELSGVQVIEGWGNKTLLITCILSSQGLVRFVYDNAEKLKLLTQIYSFLIEINGLQRFDSILMGVGRTPYNGLYGEAPPERGTLFRLEVYKRVGISRVEV